MLKSANGNYPTCEWNKIHHCWAGFTHAYMKCLIRVVLVCLCK